MSMTQVSDKNGGRGTLLLRDRRQLEMDGITDVRGFDESSVLLSTQLGALTVEGTGLHITLLDLAGGKVHIEGNIGAIFYTDDSGRQKGGFFSRMLK